MGKLKSLAALLGALKLLSVVRWLPLPGMGWVGGAASAVLAFVGGVVSAAVRGLTVIFANPVTLVTVGVVAMITFAVGLQWGASEGLRRVEKAEAERVAAYATAETRAKEALAAREAAETAEEKLATLQSKLASNDTPPRKPRSSSVRKPKANPDSDRPWMFGVPAVQW